MEKSKKFELLLQFVQALELKPQEIVELFKAKEKGFIANKTLFEPGMFYYANQTFSKELIPGQVVSGIVGYVEKNRALVVGLDEIKLPWSNSWLWINATKDLFEGKEATRLIVEQSLLQNLKTEAAQWCYGFANNGVKQGEAFLLSLREWESLLANKNVVNAALKILSAPLLDGCYWSSTEFHEFHGDSCRAWAIRIKDSRCLPHLKTDELSVRLMFWV